MSPIHASYEISPATLLQIAQGDLTQAQVDAIVNAANERLAHGGGIAGAISRAGGPCIQEESIAWVRDHGEVTHEAPAYTSGGNLPARYIIHAVGPVWGSGNEDAKLASAVRGSLLRAEDLDCKSIAFPAISTGIFGFPKQRAARIIFGALKGYFAEFKDSSITLVQIVLWNEETLRIFMEEGRRVMRNG